MSKYREDENGFITFPDTVLSKPGVFEYLGREISPELEPDKIYRVWRPEEELKNPETIESFKLAPWFPRHEMAGDQFTPAEEIGVQGTTGQDVRYEPGVGLVGTVKTFGQRLKDAIKGGLKELSCGFRCVWEIASGTTPDGLKYDVIQRNIRGNHLASVDQGRVDGAELSVAMDRACIALDNSIIEGDKMTLEELMKAISEGGFSDAEKQALKDHIDEMVGGKEANEEESERDERATEDEGMEVKADVSEDQDMGENQDDIYKRLDAIEDKFEKMLDRLAGSAMDAATIERQIEEKVQLIRKLEPVVGKIDGTGLDADGVAKKAADILGIACDAKTARAAVNGYLAAQSCGTTIDRGLAMDTGASKEILKKLDELGL